ncbi:hypothetical protein SAMN05444679_1526, partial [Variovorax sp. CF079]
MAIESLFALAPSDTDMTHPTALPHHAALDAIDRAHLIHPVSPWRVHEKRGPTVLASGR